MTKEQFKNEMSSLTSLNDKEIENIITNTGISSKDLASVMHEVKLATANNEAAANAIRNLNKGVEVLVSIAKKFI